MSTWTGLYQNPRVRKKLIYKFNLHRLKWADLGVSLKFNLLIWEKSYFADQQWLADNAYKSLMHWWQSSENVYPVNLLAPLKHSTVRNRFPRESDIYKIITFLKNCFSAYWKSQSHLYISKKNSIYCGYCLTEGWQKKSILSTRQSASDYWDRWVKLLRKEMKLSCLHKINDIVLYSNK